MAPKPGYIPYEPQLQPVVWDRDVWIVNGPEVVYRLAGLRIPCPTRMTLMRRQDGTILVHSPVLCDPGLVDAVTQLGPVAAILSPNLYHTTHFAAWAERFPDAALYALPSAAKKIALPPGRTIQMIAPSLWSPDIDVHVVDLPEFAEALIFYRPSRTLVVTDLMQNFEAARIRNPLIRSILRFGGATGPNGKASIEIRLSALRHRGIVRQAAERMLDWQPRTIILSHGRCYDAQSDTLAEIRAAFRWAG